MSAVNLPAVTVCSIDVDTKLNQKLDDLCMSGTDSIVQSSDAFIVGLTGILHLGLRSYEGWR